MPTAEEARLLRQPKSVQLLITRKVDVDTDGVPIAFSESMWSADRVTFNAELR